MTSSTSPEYLQRKTFTNCLWLAKFGDVGYTFVVADSDMLFDVQTRSGVKIRTTKAYWKTISTLKHPSIKKHIGDVKKALANPDQIRRSKQDIRVHLYYKSIGKVYVCVVADHIDKTQGYIITAYLTDRIKEGEQIYVKN
ncbi:DUF4258 domain-containing protein [Patescibacteria group bacterium]|nr:DUF4258 domain-containing protein [Patescibacteria group bacterium]